MRKFILLLIILNLSILVKAQISNEFIKKGAISLNPTFERGHFPSGKDIYGIGAQLIFMPLNRFELSPGAMYYFCREQDFVMSAETRYYLLKTKLTVFPELYASYAFNSKFVDYNLAFGAGYYGLFKRVGLDFIIRYYPPANSFFPDAKIKILLGKLEN